MRYLQIIMLLCLGVSIQSYAQLFTLEKKISDYATIVNVAFDNRSNGFYVSYVDENLGKKGIDMYDENFGFVKRIVELDISNSTSLRLKTSDKDGNLYIHDGYDIKVYTDAFDLVRSMTSSIIEGDPDQNPYGDPTFIDIDPQKDQIHLTITKSGDIKTEVFSLDGTKLSSSAGSATVRGGAKILYSNNLYARRTGRSGWGILETSIGRVYDGPITDYTLDYNNIIYTVNGVQNALVFQYGADLNPPAYTQTNVEDFGEPVHRIAVSHDGKRLLGISDGAPSKLILLKRDNISNQFITWPPDFTLSCNEPDFTLNASVTSGLPLEYISSDTTILTFVGNKGHIKDAGQVTIRIVQNGNENFLPAATSKAYYISAKTETVDFAALTSKHYGDAPFDLHASSPSGNKIYFYSSEPLVATIYANTVTLIGPGIAELQAGTVGGNCWARSSTATQLLCVAPPKPQLTLLTNDLLSIKIENPSGQLWKWYLNGEIFKTTSIPFIEIQADGNYSTVQTTLIEGYDLTCDSYASKELSIPVTALNDTEDHTEVFPNPTENTIQFSVSGPVEILVFNTMGKSVTAPLFIVDSLVSVDLSGLQDGVYFLEIRRNKKDAVVKRILKI